MVLFQSSNGAVEPNMSFLTCGDAHVVILPVGQLPDAQFFQYAECIAKDSEVDLHNVQPFYQERQKSPFFSLPWGSGVMRLKFQVDVNQILKQERLVQSPKSKAERSGKRRSVFEEKSILQDIKEYGHRRRTFGVIGVCSCDQCPDIAQAYEEFLEASKMYPNACALRCLLFDPSDSHVDQDHVTATSMIMVPPSSGEVLEQHMETIMQDFCAVMIMGLEQLALKADSCDIPSRRLSFHRLSNQDGESLENDNGNGNGNSGDSLSLPSPGDGHPHHKRTSSSGGLHSQGSQEEKNQNQNTTHRSEGEKVDLLGNSGAILRTAPEIARVEAFVTGMANPRDDNAKRLKKRKLASVQRDIGFYCLASGSPVDGLRHFSTAIELSQGAADFKTTVSALEGYLCSLLLLKEHYLKQQSMEEDSQIVWQNEELVSVEEILDLIIINLRLAASEDLSMSTLIKYARYLVVNLKTRPDSSDGADVLLKKQKQKEKMALMLKIFQDVREYEAPNLLESVTLNLELSILFEELKYFRQQVFALRKASRSLRQLLQVEGWLMMEDLEAEFPKSHGIQALIFNMLYSHRGEACQSTITKLKKMLTNEKECLQFRNNYSLKESEKQDDLLAGLVCKLEWQHKSAMSKIYEENQSSNHGPFLFSPKTKNKGRKLLGSDEACVVWVVNQLSELSLHLYLMQPIRGVDLSEHIDIQGMKLLFANTSNVVMTSFVLVDKEETREGQQMLRMKAKILPLEAGEYVLEGIKIPQRQIHDGGSKSIHTIRFQNVRSFVNVRVVNSIPLLAGRFCDKKQNTLSQLHLLENERTQFQLELRNTGELAIKRLEATWDMESDEDDEQPLFKLKHENILLEEGQMLDLGCSRRLDITLESGRIAHQGGKAYTRQVQFFVLFSEISKGGAKFSKKAIVSSLTLNISVHIHQGLILQKIFLPEDNMMTSIENQGICMEVSNQSEEVLQICQTLAKDDVEFPDKPSFFICKPLYTTKFMLMPPDKHLENSCLHWRSMYGDKQGRISLFGATTDPKKITPKLSYPIWGEIQSCPNTSSIVVEESASFEVKISSQTQEDCDVDFEIKCLCMDGSVVSRGDVILAGVLSFSNITIQASAKDTQVCKFGAYFLLPGKYAFVLTDKVPKGQFYSNSYIFEVEEKKK